MEVVVRKRIRNLVWLAWGVAVGCGAERGVESDASGVLARGLVREVACDGDDARLTLDAPSAAEPLAVALEPEANVEGEPLAPGCEGLGLTLGREVEVAGRFTDDGVLVADRVDPLS